MSSGQANGTNDARMHNNLVNAYTSTLHSRNSVTYYSLVLPRHNTCRLHVVATLQ